MAKEVAGILETCLDLLVSWKRMNKLRFNPDKMGIPLVSRKTDFGIGIQLVLGTIALALKDQLPSSEVLLYPVLSLDSWVVFAQLHSSLRPITFRLL